MKRLSIVVIGLLCACGAGVRAAGAQSLAEVAKQEKEKQKDTKSKPAKTFTNADLEKVTGGKVSSVSTGAETPASPAAGEAASAAAASGEKAEGAAAGEGEKKEEEKGEEYWKSRASDARLKQKRSKERLDLLLLKQATLNNRFYNLSDPAQRDLAQAELQQIASDIEEAKQEAIGAAQALVDLEDEARKAGALPGWLRE